MVFCQMQYTALATSAFARLQSCVKVSKILLPAFASSKVEKLTDAAVELAITTHAKLNALSTDYLNAIASKAPAARAAVEAVHIAAAKGKKAFRQQGLSGVAKKVASKVVSKAVKVAATSIQTGKVVAVPVMRAAGAAKAYALAGLKKGQQLSIVAAKMAVVLAIRTLKVIVRELGWALVVAGEAVMPNKGAGPKIVGFAVGCSLNLTAAAVGAVLLAAGKRLQSPSSATEHATKTTTPRAPTRKTIDCYYQSLPAAWVSAAQLALLLVVLYVIFFAR